MTQAELVAGYVPGYLAGPAVGPAPAGSARTALEAIVLEALLRAPCVVAFSGGRDSSAILAVAAAVAKREGLPAPIAGILAYPGSPAADEAVWQELLLERLGLERVRLDNTCAADLLGDRARAVLVQHGPVWPFTAHIRHQLLELARGGSLLTGEGGDEVLGPQRITPLVITRRRRLRPSRKVLGACALAVAPWPARRAVLSRMEAVSRPWLSTEAQKGVVRRAAQDEAQRPLKWADDVRRHRRSRASVLGSSTLGVLSAEADVVQVHPFLEAVFTEAYAAEGSPHGFLSRTQAIRHLFADVLPESIVTRTSKAHFNEAVFGPHARQFAQTWDGSGVPSGVCSPEALRAEWLSDEPSAASMPLLQHAWWSQNVHAA